MAAVYTGLFLIGLGFLVKAFPNLIAGYNTMSEKQKEKVDIEGLSTFMRDGLIVIGLIVIIGYSALTSLGQHAFLDVFIPSVIVIGVLFLFFKAKRFDQNEGGLVKSKLKGVFMIVVLVFVLVMIGNALIPTGYEINNDRVKFTGDYGTEIKVSDIASISLIDKMPPIKARTNGLGMGPIRKGFFRIEDEGKCRLFLHSFQGPFVKISTKDQETIFVNFKKREKTELVFLAIKSVKQ
ncbi:DUF3784 domain-containing protein [Belliella aquatica]|uniref:DUF3784 domain-containing protein n=1 Tax=Belliella aquatica TaxID=1323734 RepID=A0ABQ1M2H4_9BACT|nr:DUF3784 domain-containing protein [Belliella aquatica]MCH7404886.1 DUF3784 domain-containing protein [Belliella aquatica]GGC33353.1 hypothetical protein GCM10010993_10320 [Belliella aquatica]